MRTPAEGVGDRRLTLGNWLLPVTLAAILSGVILATVEWIYIVWTCGPFWIRPLPVVIPLLLYAAAALVGLTLLALFCHQFRPLRRILRDEWHRFTAALAVGGIGGSLLLIVLVLRDLDTPAAIWRLVILALVAVVVWALLISVLRRRGWRPIWGTPLLALAYLALLGMAVLLSDVHYSSRLKQRTAAAEGSPPHVCLIVMDTARGDHFSCYGYPHATSPHIDRLAGEGLLCRRAFSASNWTTPGHISIFTGKYPPQHANDGHTRMPEELVSFAEILRGHGYFCVALYNNFLAGRDVNVTQGFDCSYGAFIDTWVYPAPYRLWGRLRHQDRGSHSTFPMSRALFDWIVARGGHLCLFVNVVEPHSPYSVHQPYFDKFTQELDPREITKRGRLRFLCGARLPAPCDTARFADFTPAEYAYLRAHYDSEIAYLDAHIGAFAHGLRDAGLLDEILLVLTSDHGEFLGEQYTMRHPALLLDPVLCIPLIFRYPPAIPPGVIDNLVSNVDVCPTILGLLGLSGELPGDVTGIDILATQPPPDRQLLSACVVGEGGCYCLIEGSRKLFLNRYPRLRKSVPYERLYFDAESNPSEEIRPQAAECPEALRMQEQLEDWVARLMVRPDDLIEIDPRVIERMRALGYID